MTARRVMASFGFVVILLLAWLLAAPYQLGGPVAVVSTSGTSMLPAYAASDLVVVSRAADYDVGDVVAYHSDELGTVVMHRIVGADDEGFITQGDNNDWLDLDRPSDEQLIGTARLRIPGAGRLLDVPPLARAAAVTALAAGVLLGGHGLKRRRVRRPTSQGPGIQLLAASRRRRAPRHARGGASVPGRRRRFGWVGWPLRTAQAATAVTVLAGMLMVVAFVTPPTAPGDLPYTHRGAFGYQSDAPAGVVYPDGALNTGDPIFLRLVDTLDVSFTYEFDGPADGVEPTGALWVELADSSGWSSRSELGELGPNESQVAPDGKLLLEGTMDLPQLRRSLEDAQQQIGMEGPATVTVVAEVEIADSVAGAPFSDRFEPRLVMQLEEQRLVPLVDASGTDVDLTVGPIDDPIDNRFTRSQAGSVTVPDSQPARLELGGRAINVAQARMIGLVALGIALLGLVVASIGAGSRGRLDEVGRIRARYGRHLLEVAAMNIPDGYGLVDVRDMRTLVALADRTDRPVLHHRSDSAHTYVVEGDATVYRYWLHTPGPDEVGPVADPSPAAESARTWQDAEPLWDAEETHESVPARPRR